MTQPPEPPPEGKLIADALKRRGMSQRAAATRTGISESRWRQIVKGYTTISGTHVSVHGPPDTVARMAHVAGLTPLQLREAKREDAAVQLEHLNERAGTSAIAPDDDPYLQRLLELWGQLGEMYRRSLVGLAREMLEDQQGVEEARRSSDQAGDQRDTG